MIKDLAVKHQTQGTFDINETLEIDRKATRLHNKILNRSTQTLEKGFVDLTSTQRQFVKEMGIKLYRATDFRNFGAIPIPEGEVIS